MIFLFKNLHINTNQSLNQLKMLKRAFSVCLTGRHSRSCVVLGSQWGDEGKGKLVDILAQDYDIVGRFNGGANAGHTIEA